tara:strand:- start:654 stop:980 length:327 start_codon:yes stop_codon:yes gene_type:complete
MADADELRELRAQRQKVADHLQWLDQLIASCETESSDCVPTDHVPTTAPSVVAVPEPEIPAAQYEPLLDPQLVKSSIRAQSFGCVAVAVIVVAIAFFTLWVLPSFIYD